MIINQKSQTLMDEQIRDLEDIQELEEDADMEELDSD